MSIVQPKDAASFTTKFPLLPFAIRHEFVNHPLFKLTSIADPLGRWLPARPLDWLARRAAGL